MDEIIFDQGVLGTFEGIFPMRTSPIRPTIGWGHPVIALCKPKPVVTIFAIRTKQTQKISNAVCLIELYVRGNFNISPPTYCAIECAGLHAYRQPIQRAKGLYMLGTGTLGTNSAQAGATLWRGAHAAAGRHPCGCPLDLASPLLPVRPIPVELQPKRCAEETKPFEIEFLIFVNVFCIWPVPCSEAGC